MTRIAFALAFALSAGAAQAASITNSDAQPHVLQVTEAGVKSEVVVAPGRTVRVCASGCFLTLPNGDREALSGPENVEIVGGKAVFK